MRDQDFEYQLNSLPFLRILVILRVLLFVTNCSLLSATWPTTSPTSGVKAGKGNISRTKGAIAGHKRYDLEWYNAIISTEIDSLVGQAI